MCTYLSIYLCFIHNVFIFNHYLFAFIAPLRPRDDHCQRRRRRRGSRGHVAAKRIAVFAGQLPNLLFGLDVDRTAIVKRPRYGSDGHARQLREIFESGFTFCAHLLSFVPVQSGIYSRL